MGDSIIRLYILNSDFELIDVQEELLGRKSALFDMKEKQTKSSFGYILFFWIVLLVPILLYPAVYSRLDHVNHENRALVSWEDVTDSNWKDFFPKLESYIEDNIPYKNESIKFLSQVDKIVFRDSFNRSVLIGKENWLFYKREGCVQNYRSAQKLTEKELQQYIDAAKALEEATAAHNIQLVLLVTPNKEMIYGDRYMPERVKRISTEGVADQVVTCLRENTDIDVVYPKDFLYEASFSQQVWLKYDTHWNQVGAFIAAMSLLEAGRKDFVVPLNQVVISEGGYVGGDLANMLGQSDRFCDDVFYEVKGYLDSINVEKTETIQQSNLNFNIFDSDVSNGITALYIGDSFLSSMEQYLSKTADRSIFVHRDNYSLVGRHIVLEEQPDVIVFQMAERFLDAYPAYMQLYAKRITNELVGLE